MLKVFRMIVAVAVLAASPAAMADDRGAAIESVIQGQLDAFQRDDWDGAFGYASPNIRSMFGTPERFGQMVRGGYQMVWRPSRVEVGALENGPRGPVQIMYFEDASGALFEAAYEMIQIDGEWRINGVRVRKAPEAAV